LVLQKNSKFKTRSLFENFYIKEMAQSNSMDVDSISTPRVSQFQETSRYYTPSTYSTPKSFSSDLFVTSGFHSIVSFSAHLQLILFILIG